MVKHLKHRRSDPSCVHYRKPLTRWGDRRSRGRACPVCRPMKQRSCWDRTDGRCCMLDAVERGGA